MICTICKQKFYFSFFQIESYIWFLFFLTVFPAQNINFKFGHKYCGFNQKVHSVPMNLKIIWQNVIWTNCYLCVAWSNMFGKTALLFYDMDFPFKKFNGWNGRRSIADIILHSLHHPSTEYLWLLTKANFNWINFLFSQCRYWSQTIDPINMQSNELNLSVTGIDRFH